MGEARKEQFAARRDYLKAQREWDERNRVPFYDGITVNSEGYAPRVRKDGPSPAKLRRHEAAVAKMKKRIDKYVNDFIAELQKGALPMPSGGDCWHCAFVTEDGKSMGDLGDNSHLLSHIDEKYYVPTLAVNALRERGYRDVGIYMFLDMNRTNSSISARRNGPDSALLARACRSVRSKCSTPTYPVLCRPTSCSG